MMWFVICGNDIVLKNKIIQKLFPNAVDLEDKVLRVDVAPDQSLYLAPSFAVYSDVTKVYIKHASKIVVIGASEWFMEELPTTAQILIVEPTTSLMTIENFLELNHVLCKNLQCVEMEMEV